MAKKTFYVTTAIESGILKVWMREKSFKDFSAQRISDRNSLVLKEQTAP